MTSLLGRSMPGMMAGNRGFSPYAGGRFGPNSSYSNAAYGAGSYSPSNIQGRNAVVPGRGQPFGINLGQRSYGMGPIQALGMAAGPFTGGLTGGVGLPLGTAGGLLDSALAGPPKQFGVASPVSAAQQAAALAQVQGRPGMVPGAPAPAAAAMQATPGAPGALQMATAGAYDVAGMGYGMAGPVRQGAPTLGGIGSQGLSWGGRGGILGGFTGGGGRSFGGGGRGQSGGSSGGAGRGSNRGSGGRRGGKT